MSMVYFIRPIGSDGPVKIGNSADVQTRLITLDAASWIPLEIAAVIWGGPVLEGRFHALLHSTHIRREWFAASPMLSETITEINAGTFDPSSLPAPLSLFGRTRSDLPESRQRDRDLRRWVQDVQRTSGYVCLADIKKSPIADDQVAAAHLFLCDPEKHGGLSQAVDAQRSRRNWATLTELQRAALHPAPA